MHLYIAFPRWILHTHRASDQGNHHVVVYMHVMARFGTRGEAPLRDNDSIRINLNS